MTTNRHERRNENEMGRIHSKRLSVPILFERTGNPKLSP